MLTGRCTALRGLARALPTSSRRIPANLIHAAGMRAHGTADQLAVLFVQSTQQRLNELPPPIQQPRSARHSPA